MVIDESRDGDRCIPGWQSIHAGMAIDASRDGDPRIPDGGLEMTFDACRDGDRSIPGWLSFLSRDGFHYNPGWRSMHPGMVIDASGCVNR